MAGRSTFFTQIFLMAAVLLAAVGPRIGGTAAAQSSEQFTTGATTGAIVDYCVRCVAPQATNVCSVSVASGVVSVSEWQAFCSAQVASDGGYGQCSATPGIQTCQAAQVFSYRSTPDQGIVAVNGAAGRPGVREGGVFEGAADYVRRTGESVGQTLGDGVSAVGQGVRDGAAVVGETAGDVGRGVARGAREVGDGVTRGVGCIFTLGRQC